MANANYDQLIKAIKQKKTGKIVLLMGDEPYYIDKLTGLFEQFIIPSDLRDFNQTVIYGNDLELQQLISEAMRFPMMAEAILVVVREAQMFKDFDLFAPYIDQIPDSSVVLLSYKGKLNKRSKIYKAIREQGLIFESDKVSDYKVPDLINSIAQNKKMMIDPRAAALLADFLGNDLERIDSELDKLSITLPANDRVITSDTIQRYIGISKEYNNFELLRAVVQRNSPRAFQIAFHFARNEKSNPIQPTLSVLFNFFSNLITLYYLPQVNEQNVMQKLELKGTFQARDYLTAFKGYKAIQVYNILHQIRLTDAASKGVDSNSSSGELLKELLCYILS
ncbi:hypothetical protein HR11_06470 [Porphyromonas macacae]|uniref:DNA polymerase III subunit delta n=1 Tax=Porphyromonas macacae TaxID=28115 RepID=UPI00052B5CE1|nr:DNA polymerase III subunit delta [Porphyromonas macacae]KGN99843.1 hypothetical protein HR11_06470 [Porphyromonas macacae]